MATGNDNIELDDIWVNAVSQYESETDHVIDNKSTLLNLKTTGDLLSFIESQGNEFKEFRTKHEKVCSRLKRCLDPIGALSNIASPIVGITSLGAPASAVLSSVAYLITVGNP